jgi:predicted kinase
MTLMSARRKPVLLLVSGAPGSGKTRLSFALSKALSMYRVNKAEIARALDVTDSSNEGNHTRAWQTYWNILETLLDAGASVIADQTTWRGQCDVIIRSRLLPLASVRNVHCVTPQAEERWFQGIVESGDWEMAEAVALRERMAKRRSQFEGPLLLDLPVIEIDSTDGYTPSFEHIVEFASSGEEPSGVR